MIYPHIFTLDPAGVRSPAERMFLCRFGHQEQDVPEDSTICGGASRRIPAHGPGGVPQGGEKSVADWARSGSFAVIYGTMLSHNAVQDTAR